MQHDTQCHATRKFHVIDRTFEGNNAMTDMSLRRLTARIDYFGTRNVRTSAALNAGDWVSLTLLIIGGINWGLVGLMNLDVVAALFGAGSPLSRIVYSVVAVAALWSIFLAVRVRIA